MTLRRTMELALLQIYNNMEAAAERQRLYGVRDQGIRGSVTSGTHFKVVAEEMRNNLITDGFAERDVYYENQKAPGRNGRVVRSIAIPGWFRKSKEWDLLAWNGDTLLGVIELKSINDSYPNNTNNRTEESLGNVIDAKYAIRHSLIPTYGRQPAFGYAMVVKMEEESLRPVRNSVRPVYPPDPVFENTSSLDRFVITGKRMLAEHVYDAVWIVGVDPVAGTVFEPAPELSYEKFLAVFVGRLAISQS